jgi:hypothetical protein
MAHTPGPWKAGKSFSGFVDITTEDHYIIANVLPTNNQDDNARLLAAAPDLLAACNLISRIANFGNGEITQEEWDKYIAPFSHSQNEASMMYIMDAIKAIADNAITKTEGA